jgi:hypothetical protein
VAKSTGCYRIAERIYRLGSDNSMQVIDFPHLAYVRLFLGGAENSGISGRGMFGSGMGKTKQEQSEKTEIESRRAGRQSRGFSGGADPRHVRARVFPQQTERSPMFAYVRLKSLMFAYFEKKYFFPALWPAGASTQWVRLRSRVVSPARKRGVTARPKHLLLPRITLTVEPIHP